jgi:hypothetical protein
MVSILVGRLSVALLLTFVDTCCTTVAQAVAAKRQLAQRYYTTYISSLQVNITVYQ